jgi:hypothetical protein
VHQSVDRADLVELVKHDLHHGPRLLVGIEGDFAVRQDHVAHRHAVKHLAALRLVVSTADQAIAHRVQFDLAHRTLETQQHPVVGIARIVHAVLIGEQRAEEGAQFQQVMPVLGRARQPTHLQTENDADVVQRHFGQKPLIPRTVVGPRTALALVLVDDEDAVGRPT